MGFLMLVVRGKGGETRRLIHARGGLSLISLVLLVVFAVVVVFASLSSLVAALLIASVVHSTGNEFKGKAMQPATSKAGQSAALTSRFLRYTTKKGCVLLGASLLLASSLKSAKDCGSIHRAVLYQRMRRAS
jgi:hypothetical protein